MGFQFEANQSTSDAVKRIVGGELAAARAELGDPARALPERIHEARKHLKKVRSTLLLVRDVLGKTYAAENVRFRDLSRELSALRDLDALVECTERLLQEGGGRARIALSQVRSTLLTEREAAQDAHLARRLERVASELGREARRWKRHRLAVDDLGALGPNLRRVYAKGRRILDAARADAVPDETLHELRKAAKQLWHAVRLLQPCCESVLAGYAELLEQLSDTLGQHHDLVLLRGALGEGRFSLSGEQVRSVSAAIVGRQHALLAESRSLALRAYAETPRRFAARLTAYLTVWQTEWSSSA